MDDARTLVALFDDRVRTHPSTPAVVEGDRTYSYAELFAASCDVAARLVDGGARRGDVVAVLGPRGFDTLAALVAVLRTGAAYLPLDEATPRDRAATMLGAVGCRLVARTTAATPIVEGDLPVLDVRRPTTASTTTTPTPPGAADGADPLAYVMFTSGSTGTPKAVGIGQRAVRLLATRGGFVDMGPGQRFLHASALAFDASTIEIWTTLLRGGCLVVAEPELLLVPEALERRLRRDAVDTAFFTTSLLHHLARTRPEVFDGLAQVVTGGEALAAGPAAVVAARAGRLVNVYGPTECTAVTTTHVVDPGAQDPVPIGRPVPYARCVVLRPDGTPAVDGEDGELLIGGDGLAVGYLSDPELTARRFVRLAVGSDSETRWYRTGDRVRGRGDGTFEFRGRLDDQVKVRGFRIELGEVEHAVRTVPQVDDVAVVAVGRDADARLVAFVVPAPGAVVDLALVRASTRDRLPAWMMPSSVLLVDELPRTTNGKADRRRLERRARETDLTGPDAATPATGGKSSPEAGDPTPEAVVRAAWTETLGLPGGADVHFFESGGTSLDAARLVARIQAELDLDGASGYPLIKSLLSEPRLGPFTSAVRHVAAHGALVQEASDRWRADVHLSQTAPLGDRPEGRRVLLTGATGFFGSYLLRELLARTGAEVECLVRAPDEEAARRRISAAQARYGHPPLGDAHRVHALPADLSAPRLGLSPDELDALARRTGRIYHSAAQVNFAYPYEWLRATNVDGTRGVAGLALRGGGIPVHYVSTIAVLSGAGSAHVPHVSERDAVEHVERMSMGYPESKWVAERILGLARERGVPVSVYRPYEITGRTTDGAWNTDAAIVAFFKAMAEMGSAPDVDLPLDFVPADHLARALVHLAEHPVDPRGATFHLTNPRYGLLQEMIDRLRAAGHRIETVDYDTWVGRLRELCAASPDHPVVPFLPIFTTVAAARDVTVKELYFEGTFPRFGRENVEAGLAGTGIECPPVDASMLDSYVEWFHRTGWITPATASVAGAST